MKKQVVKAKNGSSKKIHFWKENTSRFFIFPTVLIIVLAAIGTFLVLSSHKAHKKHIQKNERPAPHAVATTQPANPAPVLSPNPGGPGSTNAWWKPASASPVTWNWVLANQPKTPYESVNAYDIDAFENTTAIVSALHAKGVKVICYIDAGSYEPNRPDTSLIPTRDIGKDMQGWPGEKWLNIADVNGLAPMINSRIQLCAGKGFDAIEPDNTNGYANDTGFPLTAANQLAFNEFVAARAHAAGLSVGLKNDLDQADQLQPYFDWLLTEECNHYSECGKAQPFVKANKAVFDAEYTSDGESTDQFCQADQAAHINGVLFDIGLNESTFEQCTAGW